MDSVAIPRRVRIRPGRILVLAVAGGALLLGACSRQTVAPAPWTPTPSPVQTTAVGCGLQQLPASWQAALKPTTMTPADQVGLLAHDASTGRSLYVRVGSPLTVVIGDPSGNRRSLYELGPKDGAQSGAIAGDWAVVVEGGVDQDLSTHGVYAYRLSGGERIDVATTAADGAGPMPWPVLYDGVAYVQVVSAGGANPLLRAVDLASGMRSEWSAPLEKGPMVRWGDLLVWQSAAGVAAFDLRTHHSVDIPQQLTSIGSSILVASDGQTIVWQGNGAASGWLRAYRADWGAAKEFELPGQVPNPALSSWGRYAVTFVSQRHLIFDLDTGQYAPVTVDWGGAMVSGGLLATAEMASEKGGSAGLRELDLTKVPALPACTR
jgi:hypothetical protein